MGTTAEKLSYLNTTKAKIKDALNLGGANITDETFREYADEIKDRYLDFMNNGTQEVWNNWTKVSGTGTEISIDGTEEAPMSLAYKGNTYQFTSNGTNLFNPAYVTTGATVSGNDITITSSGTGVVLAGTWAAFSAPTIFTIPSGKNYLIPVINGEEVNTIQLTLQGHYTGSETMTNINSNTSITGGGYTLENPFEVTAIRVSTYGSTYSDLQGITFNFYVGPDNAYSPYGATPSPSLPSPVQVVSGDNSIKVEGKNLFNKNNLNTLVAYIPASGTITPANGNYMVWFKIAQNTDFAISLTQIAKSTSPYVDDIQIGLYQNTPVLNATGTRIYSGTRPSATEDYTYTYSFNSGANNYIAIKVANNDRTDATATLNTLQLEKGTQATTYQPYTSSSYPISLGDKELCKIGTYQDKIDKSTGKNLFNKSSATANKRVNSNNGTIGDMPNISCSDYIDISGMSSIYLSGNKTSQNSTSYQCAFYNSSKTYISGVSTGMNNEPMENKKIDVPTNAKYIIINFVTADINSIMINEGETALPYEPYGTGWYVKKEIGKVVLNGSENWNIFGTGTSSWFYYAPLSNSVSAYGISNYYPFEPITGSGTTEGLYVVSSFVRIRYGTEDTIANYKTWLSSNNLMVYYVLATPTYETITDTTLISQLEAMKQSYDSQTNISQTNNDLPFELDVVALSNGTVSTLGFSLGNPLSSSQPEEETTDEEVLEESEEEEENDISRV